MDSHDLLNAALAELRANRPLDALKHLKEYVRDPRVSNADRDKAKRFIEEAMGRTGHIKVEAPAGARIRVNRLEAGDAPLAEALDVERGGTEAFHRGPHRGQDAEGRDLGGRGADRGREVRCR